MRHRKVTVNDVANICLAIEELRHARSLLRSAGAVKAAKYVAQALKSTEGAERHAYGVMRRQEQDA